MKKMFLVLFLIIMLCGCKKVEEENYKYYTIKELGPDAKVYTGITESRAPQTYAVADITPENYEMRVHGLFYEVSTDKYILLKEFRSINDFDFYNNKLYIADGDLMEYKLNKKEIKGNKVNLSYNGAGISVYQIDYIKDDYIYLYGLSYNKDKGLHDSLGFKCSLSDYKCVEFED